MLHQPPTPLRHIIFGEVLPISPPRIKNKIIVGATKEDAGFDTNTTPGGLSWLLNAATRLSPALKGCSLDHMWAGLRPRHRHQPILRPAQLGDSRLPSATEV